MTSTFTELPVIDLTRWRDTGADRRAFAAEVCRVCHEVGFFLLTGHGVPSAVLDAHLDALQRFFALDDAAKRTVDKRRSPQFRGWEPVGAELTDGRPDQREQLDLATEHSARPASTRPAYLRLDGPNQWPDEALVPGFRAAVSAFLAAAASLADDVLGVLSLGLGLDEGHLGRVFGERPFSLAKLIRYPATPTGMAGVNAHHDAGFVTVLAQHGVGGLQVRNSLGEWVDVPVRNDAFVVNLGELLQEMTGNYLVATTHRVIAGRERFSSAYFHGPDLRTELVPLPLAPDFAAAVAASPWHATAGFMATREDLAAGRSGTSGRATGVYGQQLWNYYCRSYPANVAAHHGDVT
ncbi:MAG: isopenicillin N synthase family dioxygenase [Acidimicrobiales bacterium]